MGFWGYGSVDKMPAMQMRGTEFGSQHLHEKKRRKKERKKEWEGEGRKVGQRWKPMPGLLMLQGEDRIPWLICQAALPTGRF